MSSFETSCLCAAMPPIKLHWETGMHATCTPASRMMGSWLPCKCKPGGTQATNARTHANTLQAISGKDQCSNHGHLSDWVHFAESELSWNRTRTEFMSQKRKQCTHLGTNTLGPPVCEEWLQTTGRPPSELHQCPVPHGLPCAA